MPENPNTELPTLTRWQRLAADIRAAGPILARAHRPIADGRAALEAIAREEHIAAMDALQDEAFEAEGLGLGMRSLYLRRLAGETVSDVEVQRLRKLQATHHG